MGSWSPGDAKPVWDYLLLIRGVVRTRPLSHTVGHTPGVEILDAVPDGNAVRPAGSACNDDPSASPQRITSRKCGPLCYRISGCPASRAHCAKWISSAPVVTSM